ncbi:MAG: class I SAM-dependent methyltransferase [Planctomycetota bacterium]
MSSKSFLLTVFLSVITSFGCGCRPARQDLNYSYDVYQTFAVPELGETEVVQFESVFWEPDDSESLRAKITGDRIAESRNVLEIGTGTGLLSLVALSNGAKSVVATDINPAAVANAKYNAAMLELEEDFDVRTVDPKDPSAYSVIKPNERFDLILSNPPWEDGSIGTPADHAFYDPGFALMDSILEGLPLHLRRGGRCLLAYGHRPAITRLLAKAEELGYSAKLLDDRDLDSLPRDFLPGMLIEIRLPGKEKSKSSSGTSDKP